MTNSERAKMVYDKVCEFASSAGIRFTKDDAHNAAVLFLHSDEFAITLMLSASEATERLEVYTLLPFDVARERAVDMAMAASTINARVAGGKLCVYVEKNQMTYEDSAVYAGASGVTTEFVKDVVSYAFSIIDEYLAKLYELSRGLVTIKDFLASLGGGSI